MIVVLLAVAVPGSAQIRVGFMHNEADKYDVEWRQYWGFGRHLTAEGFASGLTEMRYFYRTGWTEDQLYESLRRFHVVVWPMEYEGSYLLTDELRRTAVVARRALERYVADGGGLFVIAQAVRYPGDDDEAYNNLLIEGFGARMMHEGIFDPEREFISPQTLIFRPESYFWTEATGAHLIAEGVTRVYLPTRRGDQPAVEALEYSDDWSVVLSGEASARSYAVGHDNALNLDRPGTIASGPPIAAAREFGRGRVFVYAVPERNLFLNYGNPVWPSISEEVGDAEGGHPSDSLKLAINALRWLAEPALQVAELGSWEPAPYRPVEYPASVEWDSAEFWPPEPGVRGVVGAHSIYSDGSGTVAQYAAAARAAGLAFVVFTDPLELLTAEEFAALRADCAAASDEDFYACPGVEYTDRLGVRWASWGEKVIYPGRTRNINGQDFDYFDGRVLRLTGSYAADNGYGPNMIVGYDALRAAGAHPANLWWFFRFAPLVYEGAELVEDDYEEYLYALRDLRWMSLSSFTRVRDPGQLAAAAEACATVLPRPEHVREWCNSRCGFYHPYAARSYVTQGPRIEQWSAINTQMENPWLITRGAQRVRLRFQVSSAVGIRDVTIRDANFDVVRRFEGGGATELAREFEMVHDRQRYLQLTVTDTAGRRAIGGYWLLYCYKSGLYRCGDNLNTLGSAAVLLHPDRHQRLMLGKTFEDVNKVTVRGFDTGSGIASMPEVFPSTRLHTPGDTYPPYQGQVMVGGVLDVPLGSYDISIASMDFSNLAEAFDRGPNPTPAMGGILPLLGPHEYLQWNETAYILRSGMDYFTAWNHRRVYEGAREYRGGLIWHEGTIVVRRDVQLSPGIGLPLMHLEGPGGAEYGTVDHLFVRDSARGPLAWRVTMEADPPTDVRGEIGAGGYLGMMPTDVGYYGFLPGTGAAFAYDGGHWARQRGARGRVTVGFATPADGILRAGTRLPYRFLFATLNDHRLGPELMADIAAAYNLDGGTDGYPFAVEVGEFEDAEFFFTVRATDAEAVVSLGPRALVNDLPVRVRGVADNGCAAVRVEGEDFFRFIAVAGDTAYFQQRIAPAARLWVGNVFVCDRPDVKLTLVIDGQQEGRPPFLEVHNPGAGPVTAIVTSPPHTPVYGGTRLTLDLPAGDSVRVPLPR